MRKLKFLVPALLLISILVAVFAQSHEQHCVGELLSQRLLESKKQNEVIPARCFDTFAEAISFATSGEVNIPPGASHDEIVAAINQQISANEQSNSPESTVEVLPLPPAS